MSEERKDQRGRLNSMASSENNIFQYEVPEVDEDGGSIEGNEENYNELNNDLQLRRSHTNQSNPKGNTPS